MRRTLGRVAVATAAAIVAVLACHGAPDEPKKFGVGPSPGGGFVPGGGGTSGGGASGLAAVSHDTTMSGSGTGGSPLGVSLTVSGPLSGTGSAGNALTSSGDVSSVTAGTGLSGGGTSGALTLNVNLTTTSCVAGKAATAIAADGTATCSTFVDAVGAGLSLSGHTASANLTGGACTAGSVVTNISAAGATTCTYVTPNDYTGTVIEWQDEFLNIFTGNASGSWVTSASGGTLVAVADPTGTRDGIVGLTGTTAAQREGILTAGNQILLGHGARVIDWVWNVPTLDDGTDKYTVEIGMLDTFNSVDITDGCYVVYDHSNLLTAPGTGAGNTGNKDDLECWCAANSVRTGYVMDGTIVSGASFTTVAAPVAAGAWLNTSIQPNAAGTSVDFLVGGVKSCVITTNIPTGANRYTNYGVNFVKNAGTNLREVDVDKFHTRLTLSSPR